MQSNMATQLTAVLLMLVSTTAWGQVANDIVDANRRKALKNQEPATQVQQPANQANANAAARNAEALLNELVNLTPGKVAEGTELHIAYTDAIKAFIAGDGQKAIGVLRAQAEANKVLPPAELLFSGLLYAINDTQRGLALLEDTANKNPDHPAVYMAFARLAIAQGRQTDAGALLEKCNRVFAAATLEPEEKTYYETQLLDAMATVAMEQKRFPDARKHVERLLVVSPGNPKAFLALAELEFEEGKIDSALQNLEKFRSAQPKARSPELVLAAWFTQRGKTKEAADWIQKASQKYPDDAGVQIEFANYCVNTKNFAAANEAIKKVESAVGESPASTLLKAKIAFATQSYGVAESHYKKLVDSAPNNFDAVNMYALSLIESSDQAKQQSARQIAQRNYQQVPDNQIAQAAFGWILLKSGQTEQAANLLGRAARSPELAPEIAYFLASYMHQTGKNEQARMVLEPALKNEGFFLYRVAANKLMKSISEASGSLPNPKADGGE